MYYNRHKQLKLMMKTITVSSDAFDLYRILQQFNNFVYVVHFEL